MASWILAAACAALALLLLRAHHRSAALRRAHEDLSARHAVTAERARIAQELHDVAAHRVSVMTFGVGAGRMIMAKDPDRARETLRVAEESGRLALSELQRLLGLLAVLSGAAPTTTPQPGLTDLDDLLECVRRAGLSVELIQEGRPAALGTSVELSTYRIVQVCLDNTLRHAGARSATVTLRWRSGHVDILVHDDGHATLPLPQGKGLLNLRERTALHHGTLTTTLVEGALLVHARLSLPS
ncbi:sensor histidine kinase [Nonomuraea sp. NPDC050556]|uniref:sensor histidine kinase n=1 Tax=Nonomuraea sp. NPDC050556 TaxID=3364369 RepID=UPI00379FFD9D